MDESYTLDTIRFNQLVSKTVWGALRGLETFSQLVYRHNNQLLINKTYIEDSPRFSHRGLLIDTSRHFMPLSILLRNLDAMAFNKLNVFHWHIVDDNSFPFVSRTYPSLSEKGAYNKETHVYKEQDVETLLEYARLRGIRVIVEFDTPGHTLSWGKGVKDLVIDCRTINREYSGLSLKGGGVLQVTHPSTYQFLRNFFKEVTDRFPDEYIHIGGDEVSTECWQKSTPSSVSNSNENLYDYYMNKFSKIITNLNKKYIVWQEVYEENLRLQPNTIVQVWKGWAQPDDLIRQIVEQGTRVISSNAWYLDLISYKKDWIDYYNYDPTKYIFNVTQQKLVVGGEACIWAEYVDETNLLSRTWPRASAVAERLWSPKEVQNIDDANVRFNALRCLLKERGIPAHPINGPDYCETFVLSPIQTPLFQVANRISYASVNSVTYLLIFISLLIFLIVLTQKGNICLRKNNL
ncbi:beta-hexosaminidase subunit beta-like isoform X2 [Leptotrombidium deliense]|uniref:beta-N-acetylhexosaminidase n=1 Tax=Leptotrombidium deliense TaxID=299467 RepID=A0A443SIQ0_9ACAR|nr:beta-hexosaminidase subunit beta-like isoform X2 [Leptotrombidium deliense]